MKRLLVTMILTAAALFLASAPANGQRRSRAGDRAVMQAEQRKGVLHVVQSSPEFSIILPEQKRTRQQGVNQNPAG